MTEAAADDPIDLEAQAVAKAAQDERDRIKRLIEVGDLKWLMAHKQGRRFIAKVLEQHGVYRSSFRLEALEMAFLEGQRNHGLALIRDLHEHTPERYAEMLQESRDGRSTSSKPGSTGSSDAGS